MHLNKNKAENGHNDSYGICSHLTASLLTIKHHSLAPVFSALNALNSPKLPGHAVWKKGIRSDFLLCFFLFFNSHMFVQPTLLNDDLQWLLRSAVCQGSILTFKDRLELLPFKSQGLFVYQGEDICVHVCLRVCVYACFSACILPHFPHIFSWLEQVRDASAENVADTDALL